MRVCSFFVAWFSKQHKSRSCFFFYILSCCDCAVVFALPSKLIFAGPREARNPNLNIDQRIAYYACAPGL